MDFIADDFGPILPGQLAEGLELRPAPEPGDRVMGIAQQNQLHAVLQRFLHTRQIHVHMAGFLIPQQRHADHLTAIDPNGCGKGPVYRRKNGHLVALFRKCAHTELQPRYYTGKHHRLLRLDGQPVATLPEGAEGAFIVRAILIIAIAMMRGPALNGLHNGRSRGEIHIRHPHGNAALANYIGHIPLHAACVSPVDARIKKRLVIPHFAFLPGSE